MSKNLIKRQQCFISQCRQSILKKLRVRFFHIYINQDRGKIIKVKRNESRYKVDVITRLPKNNNNTS